MLKCIGKKPSSLEGTTSDQEMFRRTCAHKDMHIEILFSSLSSPFANRALSLTRIVRAWSWQIMSFVLKILTEVL